MTSQRWRSKEAKEITGRIRAACPDAEITVTAKGHLKVTGPGGTAILPSKPSNEPGTFGGMRTKLARYAGIHIAA
jgi:hypothetical protein